VTLPLPSAPLLAAFIAASFVLAVTPGPGVLYIVTRSIAQGRRCGLASVGGVALGNFGNAVGASVGLGALFAISSLAFTLVKYAGALYLIYLGVQALRAPPRIGPASDAAEARSPSRVFRDGFLVALLNPKTAMFFAAFLPQFIHAESSPIVQSIALGALFVLIAASTDTAYALMASAIAPALARTTALQTTGRYLSGGVFIGLGVLSALGDVRSSR
jgi:threonine/homoserine/homoserine lactone efflux protein